MPLSIEVRPVISLGESKCKRGPGQLQGFSQDVGLSQGIHRVTIPPARDISVHFWVILT